MMRAKMQVDSVVRTSWGETLKLSAVCGNKPFGPNGESEDNTYARNTPSGTLELTITNPGLIGKFNPGQKFYLDFSEAVD
jgi:hypothetical protein